MQVTTGAGAVEAVHGAGGFLSRVGLIGQDHSDGGQYTPVAGEGDEGLPASSGEPYLPAQLRQPAGLNEMKTGVTPPADGEALRFAMAELGGASASAGLPAQLSQPVETDEKMGVTPRAAPSRQESAAGPGAAPSCTGFTMPTGVPPGVHLLPPYYNPAFLQAGQGGNSMWGIAPPSASDGAHEAPEGECVGYVQPMWVAVPYPNGADLRGRASVLGGMVTPDRPASVKLKTAAAPEAEEVGEAEQLPRHTVDQDQELIANWLAHWQRTGTADIPSMLDVNMLQRQHTIIGPEPVSDTDDELLAKGQLFQWRTTAPSDATDEEREWFEEVILDNRRLQERPCRNGPQRCSHAHGFMGCWANNWKTVLCQAADHPAWHKPCKYSKHAMADLLTSQRGGSCRECGISEEDQATLPAKCNRAHGIEEARKSETRLVPKFRGGKQPGGPALAEACAEDIEWDEVTFSQHPLDHAADLLPAGVREANGGLIPLEVLHEMKLMPLGDPNRGGDLSESMRRKVNDEQRRYFAEKHITDETITYAIRTVVKLFDQVKKERDSAAFQGPEYWQWILQRFDMVPGTLTLLDK
eukprot:g2971.t1